MKWSVLMHKKPSTSVYEVKNYEMIVSGAASGVKQLKIIESIDMVPY